MDPRAAAASVGTGRRLLGCALAFVLALKSPLAVLLGREKLPDNDISPTEAWFEEARARLPSGARVACLVPAVLPGLLARTIAVARYALVPTRVTTISAPDCLARGTSACGLDDVDYVLVVHLEGLSVLGEAVRLGLLPADTPYGFQLLSRVR